MTASAFYRQCPRCGSRRGVDEVVCGNDVNGSPCNWDLTSEEICDAQQASGTALGSVEPAPVAETQTQPALRCPNGHTVSAGDLLCPECNCDLTAAPAAQEIAGWTVLSEMPAGGGVRTRYRVRRGPDGREAVLTLYSPGAEPDVTVYEALQTRVPRDHVAELLEFGRWDGRAYDVTEEILGGSLDTLQIEPSDTATIARLVEEIGRALASFMDVGLRHRALSPDKILVRSREPLDVVITGFESGRLSELDLDVESPLEVTRYTAPEAIMGGVTSASDWWGLGMILLGLLTRGECFAGINDQLFLIHVNATGAPIPTGLEPRLELLLRGLLTVDRSERWQWNEVREWLDGKSPAVAEDSRGQAESESGPTMSLGGRQYTDARRFAIDASRAVNWAEACDLLAHGQIARWAEDLELDGRTVSGIRDLGRRVEPAVGLRLGVALQLLNPQLPLIHDEAIVTPQWLLENSAAGYELITGPIPDLLSQYGVQTDNWLQRLARRAAAIRARAKTLEITLDEDSFQILALSTSRARLMTLWAARRQDFPDAGHQSLSSILARKQYSDEDLILLLAATVDQFRSCSEIDDAVRNLASQYGLPVPAGEDISGHLARPRRELYSLLEDRLAGFARCGQERCDAWADQFRLERRLPIENILLLLDVPAGRWAKPPHQDYVSSVLDFFEKKISGSILRGQLVRMTIARTTPRIDVTELAPDLHSAAALLENLLQRSERTFRLDARVFENPDGPERRMRNLLSRTTQYQRDTGINGTYIAFPFLLRRDRTERSAPRLAPVLLWPVKVSGQVGTRGDFSVAFDSEGREVLLNPAFTGMFGLEGAKDWQAIADDVLERAVAKISEIIDAFGVRAAPASRSLEPLPRDLSGVAPGDERCVCSAVLFHMEFMGQSLVEDLRQLKQRPAEGTALEPMLRLAEAGSRACTHPEERPRHVPISDRFLITHSDPSQEEAIVRARSAPGLLIQGPPGTGKSQTIVNLVADCIGHRRSVLIVCQKLPALEVVRKRLVAEDLENRLAMVTNITKDRQPLLRAIREQLETLGGADASDALRNERRAEDFAAQIETLEAQIDGQHQAVARVDDVSGRTYRRVLAELIALEDTVSGPPVDAPALRRLLADQPEVAVAELQESCGAVAGQWLEAEYEGSPLSVTLQFPHDDATITEFQAFFSELQAAEKVRAALPTRKASSLQGVPADKLDPWLRDYRAYLEGLTESQLSAAVPLQALFRDHGIGDEYRELLASLLSLQQQHSCEPLAVEPLGDLLTALDRRECEAVAELCGQHAPLWLSARYEESPLHVLRDFVADPGMCRDIHDALRDFDAAEKRRVDTTRKHEHVIPPTDPDRLTPWTAENAAFVTGVTEDALRCFAACGSAFEADRYGSQYIETLGRLATLYAVDQPRIDEPAGLRTLVSQLDESQADRLAAEMSRYGADWLVADYEESPLRVLLPFGSERHTCDAFHADFVALLAAEESRAALGPPSELALSLHDPEPLAAWLEKYGGLLRGVDEETLQGVASRLSLFESPMVVTAYIRLLRNSLESDPTSLVDEQLTVRLQEVVGGLSDAELRAVSEDCMTIGPLWLEAGYEASPLQALSTFGSRPSEMDAFRTDFAALLAAEEARVALGPLSGLAASVGDPEPLAAWLETHGRSVAEVFQAQPEAIGRLLPVVREGDLIDRYEQILRKLTEVSAVISGKLPYEPALEVFFESVPEPLASRIERECSAAADVWLESSVDKVLLESLAVFPQDAAETIRLRQSLRLLAEAEGTRLNVAARCPQTVPVSDADAVRAWLTQYEPTLLAVTADLTGFLIAAHQLFDRGTTAKSPAELLCGELQKLRSEIRGLDLLKFKQAVLERLIAENPEARASLTAAVDTLHRGTFWSFMSLEHHRARKCVAQWLRQSGISPAAMPAAEFARHVHAANVLHGLHTRASELLVTAGLGAPPSPQWQQLDLHLKTLLALFPATHRVWLAVMRCPATLNRQSLFQRATPSGLRRLVEVVRDSGEVHEAKQRSLVALNDLTPLMAASWLGARRESISLNKATADQVEILGPLVQAITQLDNLQAFRDRVAGYHPLTLQALGAMTPVRAFLRGRNSQERVLALKAVLRHHRLLARKRHLESTHDAFRSSNESHPEDVQSTLVAVAATRRVVERLGLCPAPGHLEDALLSGLGSRLATALHEMRAAVMQVRAAQAAAKALEACQRWFSPDWCTRWKQGAQRSLKLLDELRVIKSALPTLPTYQKVRTRLERAHPVVASALPLLANVIAGRGGEHQLAHADLLALMTSAWCAAQRQVLATHNSLLQSLGECRSRAQQEEALGTLLGDRNISEAILACPVTGELQAGLSVGSREQVLQSLAALEAAVAYVRATRLTQEALATCGRWFDPGFLRTAREAVSNGSSTLERFRALASALPTLSVFQAVREALAQHEAGRLHDGFRVLDLCRPALRAMPTEALPGSIHQLLIGTWLDERRAKLEASEPTFRKISPVSIANYEATRRTLLVVRELAGRLNTCPEQQVVRAAMMSGHLETVSRTLAGLAAGLEVHHAQEAALAALGRLEHCFSPDWVAACRTAIYRGGSNELALGPILAAASTIQQYQQFRRVVASCEPVVVKVFACLAAYRPRFEDVPESELATAVQRAIRHAAFTGKRLALERQHPALQAFRTVHASDFSSALEVLATAKRLHQATVACPYGPELAAAVVRSLPESLRNLLQEFAEAAEHARAVRGSLTALQELASFMRPEWIDGIKQRIERGEETHATFDEFERALPHLRAYQLFRSRVRTMPESAVRLFEALGRYRGALRGASDAEGNDTGVGDLVRGMIRREALLGWKNRLEAQEPALLTDGAEIAAKVDRLRKLEIALRVLNRQRLSQDLPIHDIRGRNEWTDITRLSGPRAVRLREFFRRGVQLGLLGLRPVWLTTPDVASQLLPLEKALFDLVIFDEASQMPVEYALPCLYRAKMAVVSGDDKQMPPSSFFAGRIESDEAEVFDGELPDEVATDQEREAFEQAWNRREIKDCPDLLHLGEAVLDRATLQVHYRSEYRELIGYSNAAFYQNELGVPVRHPDEAVKLAKPIEYLNVSGTYVSQTNPDEARRVVELLADLWLARVDEPPSVGVVTFNLRQAELIEEFLEQRAEEDDAFRLAYAREQSRITRGEDMSVFVKNVENVQGDERDWIIFSTTFGRTAKGQFSRNFGVLGQKGGERRLNVAVTRARRKVVIVSSMPIDDVSDMLRTRRKPEKPRDYLQAYLQYARLASDGCLEESRRLSDRLVTSGRAVNASASASDGFLDSVATFIRSLGYEPVNTANDPILGVDFSIADPATGLFGVGIECDPPRHRLTLRARAREIWRPSVLERAYRVVHRVSPYAWYHDADGERQRLQSVITTAMGPSPLR